MLPCGVWSGTAAADPRSCESLSASEQASCDEYATRTKRIARELPV